MRLQILTPHWKEEPWEMHPLLNSLALQQAVNYQDFGVVIVYDGEEATPLPEAEWKQHYPYEITFVHATHGGVSAARNHALDASTADYVMFCDADDMFYHACGINILFGEMAREEFDSLTTPFIEETHNPQTGEPIFVQHPQDTTFVHGKVHRRKYLADNNIRWNENLCVHEDSYFNVLCRCVSKDPTKVKYLPQSIYLWRWRDGSICRRDPDYMLQSYPQLLDSNDALVDELERRGLTDNARFYATCSVLECFFTMQKPRWKQDDAKGYREAAEKRAGQFFNKHRALWESQTAQQITELSTALRERNIREGMLIESISLPQWLGHIMALNY